MGRPAMRIKSSTVATGCLVQRYQGGGEVWTAPAIDREGNVYFGTKAGHILGFAFDGRGTTAPDV